MGKQTPGGGQFSRKAKREGESWEDTEASRAEQAEGFEEDLGAHDCKPACRAQEALG